jgi:hypothetical protein
MGGAVKRKPELDPSLNWTCGFSPSGVFECLDEATVHGFRLTDDGLAIECMMASCEAHAPQMPADYRHPMQSACGITGSRFVWPENYCYVEWGDEVPALAGAVEAVAS